MNRNAMPFTLRVCPIVFVFLLVPTMMAQTPRAEVTAEKERPMAVNADPSFTVAVIRPSNPDATGGWSFESEGHFLQCKNATVVDIMSVAYGVQIRQITGGPAWLTKDKYDIHGTPDVPGVPNTTQLRGMYQKLLAERFHLVLHREMREMSIYALTVAKGGPLLKVANANESVNTGNSGGGGQRTLKFSNMSMQEFAHNLDLYEDRPVIDQTSLAGRYDFTLKWTYDLSAENQSDAPPSLFTAIKEQLGLRMDAVRGRAEVVVIDQAERPSEN